MIAALDLGSSKVCCFIARVMPDDTTRVVGIGHQLSRGVKAGAVVDMDRAEESVRAAVEAAERMAGETVREVHLAMSAGRPASHTVGVEVAVAGHAIGDNDLRRVLQQGRPEDDDPEREVLHSLPLGFTIDGSSGVRDPRGMYGARLGVDINVVTVASGPLRNLSLCVERGHLQTAGIALAPYASGMACLVEDEMRLGVTVIDMGAGTTSMAVFKDGEMVFADSIPLGGRHVTNDVARGLATPTVHAERLKTLFASVIPGPSDDRDTIDVPIVGETEDGAMSQVSRSMLVGIVRPRIEETLELVRDRLQASGIARAAGQHDAATGGASQLQGVRELAARVLDKQVRLGRPIRVGGLAEATGGPAFSTCAGLLSLAVRQQLPAFENVVSVEPAVAGGAFSRIGRWLATNF
jgi:cell division protein FtsA